jgi:Homeodomain-like domain
VRASQYTSQPTHNLQGVVEDDPLYWRAPTLRSELEIELGRVTACTERISGSRAYASGMTYLRRELLRCILADGTFLVFAARAKWDNETPHERLEWLMQTYDLTIEDVAAALRVHRKTVERWLNGAREMPSAKLEAFEAMIAEAARPADEDLPAAG